MRTCFRVSQWGGSVPLRLHQYSRLVIWFSCGVTSSVAAKIALDQARKSGIESVVAYCDTGSEHSDNKRFIGDCEHWLDHSITVLRSSKYKDCWDVWESRRYIAGIAGAPCTSELKKSLRENFEADGDLQVFGFHTGEDKRASRFALNQPEVAMWCPLVDARLSKGDTFSRLAAAKIELPVMYRLGYANNNCIGCPKGNSGYWNKIRKDFPEIFNKMAELESRLGAKICQATVNGVRRRVTLQELPAEAGRYPSVDNGECGLLCDPPVLGSAVRKTESG